jgi:hypothetical protein
MLPLWPTQKNTVAAKEVRVREVSFEDCVLSKKHIEFSENLVLVALNHSINIAKSNKLVAIEGEEKIVSLFSELSKQLSKPDAPRSVVFEGVFRIIDGYPAVSIML